MRALRHSEGRRFAWPAAEYSVHEDCSSAEAALFDLVEGFLGLLRHEGGEDRLRNQGM